MSAVTPAITPTINNSNVETTKSTCLGKLRSFAVIVTAVALAAISLIIFGLSCAGVSLGLAPVLALSLASLSAILLLLNLLKGSLFAQQVKKLENQVQSMTFANTQLQDEVAALTKENQKLKETSDHLESTQQLLAEFGRELSSSNSSLTEILDRFENQVHNLETNFTGPMKALKDFINDIRMVISPEMERMSNYAKTVAHEAATLSTSINFMKLVLKDLEEATLAQQNQIKDLKKEKDDLSAIITEMKATISFLQEKIFEFVTKTESAGSQETPAVQDDSAVEKQD